MPTDTSTKIVAPIVVIPAEQQVSPNDIIEDDDQAILQSIREWMTTWAWTIGDMAKKYIDRAAKQGFRAKQYKDRYVTTQAIFDAIGYFVGREGRTVRYYYETVNFEFYTPDVRQEFGVLDFNMFVVAKTFKDQWRDVLEFAAVNPQASKDAVRNHFVELEAGRVMHQAAGHVQPNLADSTEPRQDAAGILTAFSRVMENLSSMVSRLQGLSPQTQSRAKHWLAEGRVLISEVASEIKQ